MNGDDEYIALDHEVVYDRHGRRITEADAEAAADIFERGDFEVGEAIYPRRPSS